MASRMISVKSTRSFLSLGIFSSVAASLCCFSPVMGLLLGSTSMATRFSWIQPARPYFIALSIIVLIIAWILKFKAKKEDPVDCSCEAQRKGFLKSTFFLSLVTVIAILMMSFPLYAHIFYPSPHVLASTSPPIHQQQVKCSIRGMSCKACEAEVNQELSKVIGVLAYTTSYRTKNSLVSYDSSKVEVSTIIRAITKTGYKVTKYEWVHSDSLTPATNKRP